MGGPVTTYQTAEARRREPYKQEASNLNATPAEAQNSMYLSGNGRVRPLPLRGPGETLAPELIFTFQVLPGGWGGRYISLTSG